MKVEILAHIFLATSIIVGVLAGLAFAWAQEPSTAELDGWRIEYETGGTGDDALVFIHGATSSRKAFYPQMADLDIGRRLLAVDLIGHGGSDKPETAYTMALFARSVAAAMDAEGIRCATLVAHSNGVPVAREFYRMYPERTEAIVAVDGAFQNPLPPEMVEWMRAAFDRPDFDDFRAGMADMMPTFALSEDDLAMIKADMLATPRHVMVGELESMTDPSIWRDDKIEVPLLVLLAQQPTWTPERIDYIREIGPHIEYHMWEGVSHFMALERRDEFNALLAEFVDRLPGCRASLPPFRY